MGNAKLLHKQKVRFVIDVEVSVSDYPQALIDNTVVESGYSTWRRENPEDFKDWLEFQKRLLHAFLKHPEVLSELVISDAGSEAATFLEGQYHSSATETPMDELLLPVITSLSEEDKKNINDSIENEVLAENTEVAIFKSFEARVIDSSIEILE